MTLRDWLDLAIFILGSLFAVIGWMLAHKVSGVGEDITKLYEMHHVDEKELNNLRLKIAENYPIKTDLLLLAQTIKDHIDERFKLMQQMAMNNFRKTQQGDRNDN
jgi:hypothetical protein